MSCVFCVGRICQADTDHVDIIQQWGCQPIRIQNADPEICSQICGIQVSSVTIFLKRELCFSLRIRQELKSRSSESQADVWALTVFMCHSQQDAQEFLRFLLDGLHNEVNRVTVRPRGTVEDFDHLPWVIRVAHSLCLPALTHTNTAIFEKWALFSWGEDIFGSFTNVKIFIHFFIFYHSF